MSCGAPSQPCSAGPVAMGGNAPRIPFQYDLSPSPPADAPARYKPIAAQAAQGCRLRMCACGRFG